MRNVSLFAEDYGHEAVLVPLLSDRLATEYAVQVRVTPFSVRGGHGKVEDEFREYVRDLLAFNAPLPDLIVVATDSNCIGYAERLRRMQRHAQPISQTVVYAIPDPHIERWLLLDASAFREVLGAPCQAPDQKCNRSRYKSLLRQAVHNAGSAPLLGGLEHALDLVRRLDLRQVARDESFGHFLRDIERFFRQWQETAP